MKIVIWTVFGPAALFWTGGAFLVSELIQWTARALASGEAATLGEAVTQWPVPQWISLWVDPALIQSLQATLLWAVETLRGGLPLVGTVVDWLVPLLWVLWGLGLVLMLVLAGGAHFLTRRVRLSRPHGT